MDRETDCQQGARVSIDCLPEQASSSSLKACTNRSGNLEPALHRPDCTLFSFVTCTGEYRRPWLRTWHNNKFKGTTKIEGRYDPSRKHPLDPQLTPPSLDFFFFPPSPRFRTKTTPLSSALFSIPFLFRKRLVLFRNTIRFDLICVGRERERGEGRHICS